MILGIDPGIAITGFALVEKKSTLNLISMGVIRTPANTLTSLRLTELRNSLIEVLTSNTASPITEAAIEKLFFMQNKTTGIVVAQARGVILQVLAERGIPIYEYAPTQIKKAICGIGNASKHSMQTMTAKLLGMNGKLPQDDAADAVAIAICHIHSQGHPGVVRT